MQYETLVQEDRVHASLYTQPQIFEDELEKIFYKVWVFIGHESEISNAGDFLTRTIGRQPVIMNRGKDQNISVFLNRCAHRGTAVCPVERGNTKYFVCPYHGWTYDLNGSLSGVPYPGAYGKDFKKEDHGLPQPARCDSYRGFIFVSLSPEGPSPDENLGKAKKLIDHSCELSQQGEIQLSAGWLKHRYHSNWKMIPENDTDGYHLGITHRAFLRVVGTQYARFVGEEDSIKAVLRDWGNGHSEIEWAPGYQRPFDWCGGGSETKFAAYLSAMEKSYGKAVTQ